MSVSLQLHCHRNFQKTYYPEISVQSPGSDRAPASRLYWLFKRNRLCVLSPTPHYGRREKESGKWEREGENLRGEGKAPLERLPLSPWVVSLTHSSNVIKWNSEPEKYYPTNRTIGSLLSMLITKTVRSGLYKKWAERTILCASTHLFSGRVTTPIFCI